MLTDQDRESLAWTIYGGGPSREEFAASIEATVEAIVARHVAAALNAAADEIDAETALQERCESKAADDGDPDEAAMYEQGATVAARCARIVRTAANSPPT